MRFIMVCLFTLSCSQTSKIYQYQAEHVGKEYHYMFKANPFNFDTSTHALNFSMFNTSQYYVKESSTFQEFSYTYSLTNKDTYKSFQLSVDKGHRTLFNKSETNPKKLTKSFYGFSLRYDYSKMHRYYNFRFSLLNIQFVYHREYGDYYSWREEEDKAVGRFLSIPLFFPDTEDEYNKRSYIHNYNPSPGYFSMFLVPEINYFNDKNFQIGLFGGYGLYIKAYSKTSFVPILGSQIQYKQYGLSYTYSLNQYSLYPSFVETTEEILSKHHHRFDVSISL